MNLGRGQTLSHYLLVEKIGEGGMGVVWRAEDTILSRAVAIKVLPADAALDESRRRMFLKEARLLASVNDAHIVQIHELGRDGDLDFIVMEHVDGKPLSQVLHGRPLPPDTIANFGEQVARALAGTHRKRLVHRDLKPGNILVTPDGDLKVVDFGVATLFDQLDHHGAGATSELPTAGGTAETTRPLAVRKEWGLVGSLPYMSPEQVQGGKLDGRTDIFSLGVVLYEMTTGRRPFTGRTSAELLPQIIKGHFKPVYEVVPEVPLDLNRIVQKAMSPRRQDRYQTMEDLAVDLKRLGKDLESGSSPSFGDLKGTVAPEKSPRLQLVGLAAALLIGVAAAVGWLTRSNWDVGAADPHTVLILPMDVRGQSEGADYVGRAFAEALAFTLAQARDLTVLPVAARPKRERSDIDPVTLALNSGAGRLLTGAVTREGAAIDVSLSLTDATKNRILWGVRQRAENGDVYALVSSLVALVTGAMATPLPETFAQEFDVEVSLLRQRIEGDERLEPGERVRPGDRLFIEIQLKEGLYVYVVNEDEKGGTFLLFPLSLEEFSTPLLAGIRQRLPASRQGQQLAWQVTSAGIKETFLVIASREPLRSFETLLTQALSATRQAEAQSSPIEALKYLALDRFIQSGVAERGSGLWIRTIQLENPEP